MTRFNRERYRRAVQKTRGVSHPVRLLLLEMLQHADAHGYVTITRRELAKALATSPPTITDRTAGARASGWLNVVERGQPPNKPTTWSLVIGSEVRVSARPRADRKWDRAGLSIGRDVPTADGVTRPDLSTTPRPPESRSQWVGTGPDPDRQPPTNVMQVSTSHDSPIPASASPAGSGTPGRPATRSSWGPLPAGFGYCRHCKRITSDRDEIGEPRHVACGAA